MKQKFHFQVNTKITYDVAEIEAETLEEACEKMREYWQQNKGYEKIVMAVPLEEADDFNTFMGINVV